MSGVHIQIKRQGQWNRAHGCLVNGHAFNEGKRLPGEALATRFAACSTKSEVIELLRELNGFFGAIVQNDEKTYLLGDRIRSTPIYYGVAGCDVYVGDDAQWIRNHGDDERRDWQSEAEFLLTGYVTGPETLYSNVKQVQAGEIVEIDTSKRQPKPSIEQYYRYTPLDHWNEREENLLKRLDEALTSIFERLIAYADGRPIVVPLSGGYDSRLAVLMLKRLGYENVTTFSFGRKGNAESTVSKDVAEHLDVPWKFVNYTNEKWYDWFHSEERREFYEMVYDYAALPGLVHMVWPAVWELRDRGAIPDDALFVPGHSADFVAGSHLPDELLGEEAAGRGAVVDAVWGHHYNLWQCGDGRLENALRNRIHDRLRFEGDLTGAFEEFDWQERQSKFILADLRTYEFWGYDWWIPFWDREFMNFWRRVPNELRDGKTLYDTYVEDLYSEMTGIKRDDAKRTQEADRLRRVHGRFKSSFLFDVVKPVYKRARYAKAVTAWPGIMPKRQFLQLYTGNEGRHAFFVLDLLGKVSFDPPINHEPPINGEITAEILEQTEEVPEEELTDPPT